MPLHDFHIGEGGALRLIERAAKLETLRRQVAIALSVTWLPLVIFGLGAELLVERRDPVVRDLSVHVRLLIAIPAFLYLDQRFPRACRRMLGLLSAQGFIPRAEEPRVERILSRASRVSNAILPELLLAALALALGAAALAGYLRIGGLERGPELALTRAWYALVGWPLFQFLLWRSLFRWAIWGGILAGLSRIELALVPTHPDRRCGIRFLGQPSIGYCAVLLFAVSSVLSAELGHRFSFATLESFKPLVLVFGAVGLLVAFGPLLAFVPKLVRARLVGLIEADADAAACARRSRERRADVAQLAYHTEIYRETVARVSPFLFTLRDALALLVATLLPVVPVMVAQIPAEDWRVLLTLITGGRLG